MAGLLLLCPNQHERKHEHLALSGRGTKARVPRFSESRWSIEVNCGLDLNHLLGGIDIKFGGTKWPV